MAKTIVAKVLLAAAVWVTGVHADGPEDGCVVVTGATGFVAGHVIKVLLEKGYTVHGTVRKLADEAKFEHLKGLEAKLPGTLKLFESDIADADAFQEASKSCWGMLHLATTVVAGSTPPEEQINIAIKGTEAALKASTMHGHKSVVVTASTATVAPRKEFLGTDHVYNEEDWNNLAEPHYGTYAYSKTQAEKRAFEIVTNGESKGKFRYSTIHFPLGLGPQLDNRVTSSNGVVEFLMLGSVPLYLPLEYSVIDVRDVARAHVHVLEHPDARGRYIVGHPSNSFSMGEIADIIREKYPTFPVPTIQAPFWLARLFSRVDTRIGDYELDISSYGGHPGYDGSKISKELGFVYAHPDGKTTIQETAESMVDLGIATGKRVGNPHFQKALPAIAVAVPLLLAASCAVCCRSTRKKSKNE